MANFILTKTQKGKKFQYQVIDTTTNEVISSRTSARDYVACTTNGAFYFGRLDLIGKGDHGKQLSWALLLLNNPKKAYENAVNYWVPSFRKEWKQDNPFEKWVEAHTPSAEKTKEVLEKIAYLKGN